MKTAEQWLADKQWCHRTSPNTGNFTVYGIEAIQADAQKQLREALLEARDIVEMCLPMARVFNVPQEGSPAAKIDAALEASTPNGALNHGEETKP